MSSTLCLMVYPVNNAIQLRAVLRALRQSRDLSQTEVGTLLGVNQKRVARIENAPGLTSFDQIARLISALGGRLVVETSESHAEPVLKKRQRKAAAKQESW